MPTLRYQPPERLLGAANFASNPALCGSTNLVKLVKDEEWASNRLRNKVAALESDYGRHRKPGRWELAMIAYVTSGHVALQRWYNETKPRDWRQCGFRKRPSYQTVNRRFHELEREESAFLDATSVVIQRCIAHDPRIMSHMHVDSTEDETHARLVHDCQPGENCQRRVSTTKAGKQRGAPGSALRPLRAATSEARAERQKWNALDQEEGEKRARESEPVKRMHVTRNGRKMMRVLLSNGCWYVTRDVEAGVRAYDNKRFWHGYYNAQAIDHLTGGTIPLVVSASTNESKLFPDLYDRVKAMTGRSPQTVTGDKGFSWDDCFKHATSNGTAPVFPWRPPNGAKRKREDKISHDRHGVPRCKYCGGPTRQTKFSANNGKPRVWFQCVNGKQTPDCARQQTIYCEKDWLSLIPLPRTEPLYHELKASHQQYEGVHDYERDRYRVGASDLGTRPRTIGLGPHRLRAAVACFINWLRIAKLNNWIDNPNRAKRRGHRLRLPKGVRRSEQDGKEAARIVLKSRSNTGLAGAYGPKAAALGIGDATPPSQRAPAQGARGTPQGP